ncbi:RNA-directed DNA polymerase, eukaryota [Tanacetum coccineum]
MGDRRSKEDGVLNISTSIFVTNFPDQTNAKELWSLCNQYGNVIDAFIPNRRSKVGKRFGFIRFIKISDVERLVNNLCTIWIGKHKLHANIARYNRPPLIKGGYPSNVKANTKSAPVSLTVCLIDNDSRLVSVGKLKEFGWAPNFKDMHDEESDSDVESVDRGVNQAKGSACKENDSMTRHKESVNALVGSSGGILCVWDSNMFLKKNSTVLDYFIAIMGTWLPNNKNMLIISVYAPQELAENYLNLVINRWKGDVIVMGDFNKVRSEDERYGSIFNARGAAAFNSFISTGGLLEVPTIGLIRGWVKGKKDKALVLKKELKNKLSDIDSSIDKGKTTSTILEERMAIMSNLSSLEKMESIELAQKAKVKWSIEGDENSKFFHGIINKRRNNLAIRGIVVDGVWIEDPIVVKNEFLSHFQNRFNAPRKDRFVLDMDFPDRLSLDQAHDLEKVFSKEEIKGAVWDCGLDKSSGPDGYTFGFYRGNYSFIALIPKTQGAKMVKDFRPISLIGSLYKIITKLLANRLVTVIDGLVNGVQSAFIVNCQILDGPFILNEIIHWCKAKKKQTMIFKVDFEKAFDYVRWDFLDDVLKNFGFGSRWREWIQSCLKSSRGSILVNGSPTSEFQIFKGLKQGDPLSPFLFILVMESLHLSFQNVVDAGLFKGQWCESNIATIIRVLDCFYRASGLHINLHKSKLLGLAVENDLVNLAANSIGCMTLSLPFSYLGVNIGGHMLRISSWDVVIDKVLKRLSKWKIKSFLYGVDPSVRNTSFIKWDNVLASKEKGGLGVSSFFALNRALIFKWVWRFRSQSNSLWSRVIKALHGTMFWQETWKGEAPFKIHFPRLFALESNKRITVEEKMKQPSLVSSFRHNPRGGIEQVQMDALSTILEDLILPSMKNRWSWSLSGDGEFSVSSARSFIDAKILETVGSKTQWCKYVPIKINILSWRAKLNNLPTRLNLSRRGMDLQSIFCPSCNQAVESTNHIFFNCSMMKELYKSIARWWNICMADVSSYEDWWSWFSSLRLSLILKKLLEGFFYVSWWVVWNFRNKSIFGASIPTKARLFYDIVALSFSWCNSRSKLSFSWLDWLKNPLLISV